MIKTISVRPLVVALAIPLTACSVFADEPQGVDRSTGPLAQQSFQWSAASGVELVDGAAVPIRAYLESRLDAQTMGSLSYAYPGFDRAVASVGDDDRNDLLKGSLRPDEAEAVGNVSVGDSRLRLQSIAPTGATVTATLCNYRYGMALENENGTYSSVAGTFADDDGIDAMRVLLTSPAEPGSLPPQTGPARAPSDDVFGDWKITGFLTSWASSDTRFAQAWPTHEADLAKCVADAPDPPERRAFLITGEHARSDFPTSPPSPGWPEPSE